MGIVREVWPVHSSLAFAVFGCDSSASARPEGTAALIGSLISHLTSRQITQPHHKTLATRMVSTLKASPAPLTEHCSDVADNTLPPPMQRSTGGPPHSHDSRCTCCRGEATRSPSAMPREPAPGCAPHALHHAHLSHMQQSQAIFRTLRASRPATGHPVTQCVRPANFGCHRRALLALLAHASPA